MYVFAVSFVCAATSLAVLIPALRTWQIIDIPNARSSHVSPVPRGGGIGVLVGIGAGFCAAGLLGDWPAWLPLVVALVMGALGLVDDMASLPGTLRLGVQAIVLSAACWVLAGSMSGTDISAYVFVPAAAFACVGFVNAFNFMDGVNGISALNATVAGLWFAWLGSTHDVDGLGGLGLALAGASLGFLPWNAPRAKVFLGDVGSYAMGALIVTMSALAWSQGVPLVLCLAPLAIYVADTGWAVVKRARGGRPLMDAHREHVYQRLVDAGWSHLATGFTTAGASVIVVVAVALVDTFVDDLSAVLSFVAMAVVALAYLCLPLVALGRESVEQS